MDELACEEVTVAAGDPDPRETGDDENHVSLWGGFDPPPSWAEYFDEYEDDLRPYLGAARRWLTARGAPYPAASRWCNDHYLRFSDGTTMSFTWRAWGDFVQAGVGEQEGYMTYYTDSGEN